MGELQLSRGLRQVSEAVKQHIRGWRLPPSASKEDIAQEVHANLAKELGHNYGSQIEEAMAEGPNFKKTPAYKAIMHCLWRAEYSLVRRKAARGAMSLSILAEPESNSWGVEAVDMSIDLAEAMNRLNPKEQHVWKLMCEGHRTTEIAGKLGMAHQRASEMEAKIRGEMARVMRIIKE